MLKEIFTRILNEYQDIYTNVWKTKNFTNELFTFFNNDVKNEVSKIAHNKNPLLLVNSSTGVGKTTKTPWIAIFDKRITTKASEGTYIVYLFNKDEKCVYLALEQSITEAKLRVKNSSISGRRSSKLVNTVLEDEKQRVLNLINHGSFNIDNTISTGKKDFDITAIMYKKYCLDSMPEDDVLETDLHELIDIYEQYYVNCVVKGNKDELDKKADIDVNKSPDNDIVNRTILEWSEIDEMMTFIYDYVLSRGFVFDKEIIKNFYLGLKSKPFAILAGISGTGKSKFTKLFAEAIDAEYKMISVRPDWSDSSDLFGHVNLDGNYVKGPIIDFIKDANSDLDRPYILCLDEMNLARVEYYFSDFLSIIETRDFHDGIIQSEHLLDDSIFGNDEMAKEKYKDLVLSQNLYVVGTVNMDETTFPFSKKVLDRANTIEFSDVDLSMGMEEEPNSISVIEPISVSNDFLKSDYLRLSQCYDQHSDLIDNMISFLEESNKTLTEINAQVAYRVRDEIGFYLVYNSERELILTNEAIDNSFLQKILPRVQGSSLSLKKVLINLFNIAAGTSRAITENDSGDVSQLMYNYLTRPNENDSKSNSIKYPNSAKKIAFMMRRYEDDGYTSYWL